ncbi:MAG TPA: universal stress protein [Polyangiales bacterium]|nr:universal stress protein [Polyangiales bacterium]
MDITKILVATDFSPQSDAAIRHGIHIARSTGAQVLVVHVVETPADEEGLASVQSAIERWHADDEARLTDELEAQKTQDVEIEQQIVDAPSTAEGLQAVVEAHDADLTIVGSTGLSGIKETLLGSTAQKVLRTVRTNILVARGNTPPGGYQRILIPTDFSDAAENGLQLAVALAPPNARFDLIHFWRVPEATRADEYSEMVIDAVGKSAKEQGMRLLQSFLQRAPNATFQSVQASPERGIQKTFEERDYDLVVVGSYGKSKLRRWLLGSVAEYTTRTAPCSVAVARGK